MGMHRPSPVRRVAYDDSGFAMILVIGFTGVLAALITVGTAIGIRTLQSSSAHVNFENALAVAEMGVDGTLAQISDAFNAPVPSDFVTSGPCAITAPGPFSDDETERRWARDALTALPDGCLEDTPNGNGEYVAVRPTNVRAVYSMSWVPDRLTPGAKKRLIKAEYLFAPYKPTNAVLTQSQLNFAGSVAVTTISTTPSDVHSNATITGFNGSTSIAGSLSASGNLAEACTAAITGGCTEDAPLQGLPNISARRYYDTQRATYASSWFDLCPDGVMRGPSPTGAEPCQGSALPTTNGWMFSTVGGVPTWTLPRTAGGPFNGIYYVFRGNAEIGDSGNSSNTWQISVLAEAETGLVNATTCGKRGGNINWKLFNLTPWLSGLQMLADANLTGDANANAGSGLFMAGDKVDLQTSSSTITGAVIAANKCAAAGQNQIQGVTVRYDDTLESPLSDVIRTSLWLDYAAG